MRFEQDSDLVAKIEKLEFEKFHLWLNHVSNTIPKEFYGCLLDLKEPFYFPLTYERLNEILSYEGWTPPMLDKMYLTTSEEPGTEESYSEDWYGQLCQGFDLEIPILSTEPYLNYILVDRKSCWLLKYNSLKKGFCFTWRGWIRSDK